MRFRRLCLPLLAVSLFAPSCGPIGIPIERLAREIRYCGEYRNYRKLDGAKAWAVAGDPCGIFVSGLTYEEADLETAVSRALMLCEARRADRRVGAPCVVHARGDCATADAELRYCRSLPHASDPCPEQTDPAPARCPDRSTSD